MEAGEDDEDAEVDDTELPPELRMDEYDDSEESDIEDMDPDMLTDDIAVSFSG